MAWKFILRYARKALYISFIRTQSTIYIGKERRLVAEQSNKEKRKKKNKQKTNTLNTQSNQTCMEATVQHNNA